MVQWDYEGLPDTLCNEHDAMRIPEFAPKAEALRASALAAHLPIPDTAPW